MITWLITYALIVCLGVASPASAEPPTCPEGKTCCGLKANDTLGPGNASADLAVLGGVCTVNPGATYMYRNINIYDGGQLVFGDGNGAQTDLWAANIIVEDKGTMRAGSVDSGGNITPINGPLIIHLYGANQGTKGVGAVCLSDERCGVPKGIWDSNNLAKMYPNSCSKRELPNDLEVQPKGVEIEKGRCSLPG